MRLGVALLLFCQLALAQANVGEHLYQVHCAICHGASGPDGFAANLAVPGTKQKGGLP